VVGARNLCAASVFLQIFQEIFAVKRVFAVVFSVFLACSSAVFADAALDELKQQMQQLQQEMQSLQKKIRELEAVKSAPTDVVAPVSGAPVVAETAATAPLLRIGPAYLNLSFSSLINIGWSSADDVEDLQRGGHDPLQRGVSLPNNELTLEGAVDPYFKGFAAIVLKVEPDEDVEVELEEAYLLTTALPWNLQLKAGRFFTEFGRQNQQHPHQWAFVDQPLVLNRLLGPDGLQQNGARISWLAPMPFYTELFLGVFNGQGETAWSFRNPDEMHGRESLERGLRGPGDLLFVPRIATSFDLSDTQTLMLGASAAFGPNNTGPRTRTEVYGADLYWKWRPVNALKGFPFVAWQTEALYRRFEAGANAGAGLGAETLGDWGFYSQLLWGFAPRWVAGLRGEFVSADTGEFDPDPLRADRTRLSPNLTWYPTEFSKIRLQYNYDRRQSIGNDHSVWMQIEFLLGAHGAHKF
jgi:hypothetical protein